MTIITRFLRYSIAHGYSLQNKQLYPKQESILNQQGFSRKVHATLLRLN